MRSSRRRKLLVSLAAIGCFGTLAAHGIFGAFSAQTVNSGNEFSSATLNLTSSNQAMAEPVYAKQNAVPGDSGDTEHSCIEITYTGTVPAEVRLFGNTNEMGTGLADAVMLRVTEGDGGVEDGCATFVAAGEAGDVYGGNEGGSLKSIREFHLSYPRGIELGTWNPGESHVYRFQSWLDPEADPIAMQGRDAGSQSFVWEARAGV